MVERGARIFVDTMVIIEAHRVKQWKTLCDRYSIRTVEKCVEELATGNQRTRNPVFVDTNSLNKVLKPGRVSEGDIARLVLNTDNATSLDEGEKHLLAFVLKQDSNSLFVCSPDKACMRAGHCLGWLDRFVSLETLLDGIKLELGRNFTEKWLASERTKIKLGSLA